MKYSKAIDIEDFHSRELNPYLMQIASKEMSVFGIKEATNVVDSKNWEAAMALYSFDKHDLLKQGKCFAAIGAETELLTKTLADMGAVIFPTDRFLDKTFRSDSLAPGYMVSVSEFNKSLNNAANIIPVHSDARALDLPSDFFDGVYSSGTLGHLGGLDAVDACVCEIARVLKPGGYASISTELWLDGPEHLPWFDAERILFTPALIEKHIVQASGLISVGIPDNFPSPKTFETRQIIVDLLNVNEKNHSQELNNNAGCNLIIFQEGFLFCSVHVFLRKPMNYIQNNNSRAKVDGFKSQIRANNLKSIEDLRVAFLPSKMERTRKEICLKLFIKVARKFIQKTHSFLSSVPCLKYCASKVLKHFPKIQSKISGIVRSNLLRH